MCRFRWVVCQLDALQKCLTAASLKKTLRTLPKTLYDTYDRILLDIDSVYREQALQILRWLVVSQRPLYIEEAAEAITTLSTTEEGLPVFDADNRLSDPNDVFQICLSLVNTTITADSRSRDGRLVPAEHLRLAHYSVKEYLTSEAISWGPCSGFVISETDAHVSVSQACIAYLLNIEGHVSGDTSVELPLADYAANFWNVHAELGRHSKDVQLLESMIIELLGSVRTMSIVHTLCKPHYPVQSLTEKPALHWAVQYGLSNVVARIAAEITNINMRDSAGRTALHVAIQFRRESIARFLLVEGIDVDAQDYEVGTNALHYAVHTEDVSAVQILLDAGADPNIRTERRSTPLYLAAERNNMGMVRLLLARGADPNAPSKLNSTGIMGTPLQVAAWRGYSDIVSALLDAGAVIKDVELSLLAQGKVREALQAVGRTGAGWTGAYPHSKLPNYDDIITTLQNHATTNEIAEV